MKEKAKMKISNVQTKIQIIYKIFLIIKKGKNVYQIYISLYFWRE